ncbi:hypothetical protein LZ318_19280 [Saccharopolyspora indica]|uniref:hypothetical protein n=1 Tax=Saccharopolyspora indica TaxID=1229659 RepID=UPI0022EA116D|nr:hypothetical protein [Saccharopolyspora indica]MDA3643142.1 hypothetical protein [Saccharopolyspora indica]
MTGVLETHLQEHSGDPAPTGPRSTPVTPGIGRRPQRPSRHTRPGRPGSVPIGRTGAALLAAPVRTGVDHHHAGDLATVRDELRTKATRSWTPSRAQQRGADIGARLGKDGDTDQAVRYLQQSHDTGEATFGPQAGELLAQLSR